MSLTGRSRGPWLMALLLGGCAAGGQVHQEGLRLQNEGNHDAAVARLREALRLEPTNARYRIDLLNEQAALAEGRLRLADDARRTGRLDDAALLYQQARLADPGNERALRALDAVQLDRKNARAIEDGERLLREGGLDAARRVANGVLTGDPASAAGRRLMTAIAEQQEKLDQARAAQLAAQSVLRRPVTLQFRDANLRMVFEALSRTTGLNVILDRDVRADLKTTIFVKDASVEDTVDLILLQNQLEKRTLNANTLFVYPATAAKQKEYQDLQVRTFQVANADVKYLQTVLKTVLKVKEVSMDERTGTLVIRDTPDAIAVAAKVIAAHDVPDPEVMLEVEVLEISHDRLSNLGIQFPDSLTLSTPADASGGSLTVAALRALRFSQLLTTPLSLGVNLKLQDTDAQLLASPRIRARNKEKARILIGDRVPIIVNTVTPVATGAGVVTGSVSYQDVGLKLEFEPQVYSDQEVGIRISLEVSTIVKEIGGPNGSLAYQIGTRNAQTSVRLRDGETQILGGLISADDRNTASKIPGSGTCRWSAACSATTTDRTRRPRSCCRSRHAFFARPPSSTPRCARCSRAAKAASASAHCSSNRWARCAASRSAARTRRPRRPQPHCPRRPRLRRPPPRQRNPRNPRRPPLPAPHQPARCRRRPPTPRPRATCSS